MALFKRKKQQDQPAPENRAGAAESKPENGGDKSVIDSTRVTTVRKGGVQK